MKNSYANQASRLMKKYKYRLGGDLTKDDKLARQGLDIEMSRLREAQEADKIVEAKKSYSKFMKKYGGSLPKYDGKEKSWLPGNNWQNAGITVMEDPYELPAEIQDIVHKNALQGEQGKLLDLYTDTDNNVFYGGPEIPKISNVNTPITNSNTKELYSYQQNLMDAAPLLASVAGNALMYAQGNKEPRKLKLKRVSSDYEKVDLSREREVANREANLTRNINVRNARNLGLSGGAAATLASASNVDVSRGLGEQIGRSYMNEELANTQAANQAKGRADAINSNLEYQEKVHNIRQSDMSDAMKQQAIQNIIGDVGSYFGDVSKKQAWTRHDQLLTPDYALYEDPNQSKWNRRIFGNNYTIGTK